jgi:hypothetical protein
VGLYFTENAHCSVKVGHFQFKEARLDTKTQPEAKQWKDQYNQSRMIQTNSYCVAKPLKLKEYKTKYRQYPKSQLT